MSRRSLLLAAAFGLVAAACADDPASLSSEEAVTTTSSAPSPTTALADAPAPQGAGDALDVDIELERRIPAAVHVWTIELTNDSDEPIVITFPTSQPGDVAIVDDDAVVHRWSDGRFFRQQVTETRIEPGATEAVELSDDLSAVEPGYYEIELSIAVVAPPEPLRRSVRIVAVDAG